MSIPRLISEILNVPDETSIEKAFSGTRNNFFIRLRFLEILLYGG